jgi:hypothetical protein
MKFVGVLLQLISEVQRQKNKVIHKKLGVKNFSGPCEIRENAELQVGFTRSV